MFYIDSDAMIAKTLATLRFDCSIGFHKPDGSCMVYLGRRREGGEMEIPKDPARE
jgi:hypothetical protein